MTNKEKNKLMQRYVNKAVALEEAVEDASVVKRKWVLGWKLARDLKASMYQGQTIDEKTFLGRPYVVDYDEHNTIMLAITPQSQYLKRIV